MLSLEHLLLPYGFMQTEVRDCQAADYNDRWREADFRGIDAQGALRSPIIGAQATIYVVQATKAICALTTS